MNGKYKHDSTQKVYCFFGPIRTLEAGEDQFNSGLVLIAFDLPQYQSVELWYGPNGLYYVPRVKRAFDVPCETEPLMFYRRAAEEGDYKTEFAEGLVDGFGKDVFFCKVDYLKNNFTPYDL